MAAYSQSITLAQLNAIIEHWNDVNDKKAMERVFSLIITEFAAMETAGLAGYTVTSGLQASMEQALDNVSNCLRREHLRRWITDFVAECTSVQTDGLGYTVTTSATVALETLLDILNRDISYMPDSIKKISFHEINTDLNTEFGLCEDAS